jgi:hypothetical protein
MKSPFTPLTLSALFAALILFSGLVSAEAYDIRLQTRLALEAMAEDQRTALREETLCTMQARAEELAAMALPWQTEYLASFENVEGGESDRPVTPAAMAAQSAAPKQVRRTSKFGLPYFSFGKLLSGNKDN